MSKNSTWVIIGVIVIIAIAGIWWYSATQHTASYMTPQSSAKAINTFDFAGLTPAVSGTIDTTDNTISVVVPDNTNVTALVPTITISDNATISPASGAAQDFTNPVTYTVTAQDGSTQSYEVTVLPAKFASLSYSAAIKLYPNKRIQFAADCVINPSSIVFKEGTTIMLDNRASTTIKISLDGHAYWIGAYKFLIVTLTTPESLPHTMTLNCSGGKNNASIYLEK